MVMLDGWMVMGVLADKHNEFCIQRYVLHLLSDPSLDVLSLSLSLSGLLKWSLDHLATGRGASN